MVRKMSNEKKILEKLVSQIDLLALDIIMLNPEHLPGLGEVLKSLESMETLIREIGKQPLISLIEGMKGYIEKLILGEKSNLSPFESGISQLQEICRHLINGKTFFTSCNAWFQRNRPLYSFFRVAKRYRRRYRREPAEI